MDDKLADNFIRLIDDSATNGVPEIHFRFWRRADETARQEYIEAFRSDSDAMGWFADGYFGDDPDFDALLAVHPYTLMTDAVMGSITDGWQRGRAARNLDYARWEDRLEERVDDLRAEYGLAA